MSNENTLTTEVAFGSNPQVDPATIGLSGKVFVVHKTNEEGGLLIDAFSGAVLPNQPDRPEWSSGYALAQLSERHGFYASRLGADYADEHKAPASFNADDLCWLGLDEEGLEVEVSASSEYRAEVVKSVLVAAGRVVDIDTAEALEIVDVPELHADTVMVDIDRERTPEELAAIQKAATSGFMPLTKTGTQG